MALLEEMRTLVGDLELAASRRAAEERARQEAAARDAHERAARTANRRAEVGKTLGGFHRERATVAWGTRGRGPGMVGLRGALGGGDRDHDAAARTAGITDLRAGVWETLGGLRQERLERAAWDSLGRVEDERDRQATAAQDSGERAAEIGGLRSIWRGHAAMVGSLR